MPSPAAVRTEIERLHEFFVDWYAGAVDPDDFDRVERALAPGFGMVTPDGARRNRGTVVEGIRDSYGRDDPGEFDIDIRNVGPVREMGEYASARYEEWHHDETGTTGRVSTALFRAEQDAPGDLVWLDVHETWVER